MSDLNDRVKKLIPTKRKRLSLFLDPKIYSEARRECKMRGIKISWIIEDYLKTFLEDCKKAGKK